MIRLLLGDCAKLLPTLPANTYDSLITDPPASINFMGQKWDGDRGGRHEWCAWLTGIMRNAIRVLKPGITGLCGPSPAAPTGQPWRWKMLNLRFGIAFTLISCRAFQRV